MTASALSLACGELDLPAVDGGSGGDLTAGTENASTPVTDATSHCVVSRVVDGDSLECEAGRRLRLLLIDSPELDQAPFGAAARSAMDELAPVGTGLTLAFDVERRDDYGRELVHATLPDGRVVNEEMLRRGYAVVIVFPPNVRHVDRYRAIADSARTARRGLWAEGGFDCYPIAHRTGRC